MSPSRRAYVQEEHEQSLLALEANHADPGCESTFAVCAAKQVCLALARARAGLSRGSDHASHHAC